MAKTYFFKEILGSGLSVQGSRVPFEPLAGNQGVIALDTDTTEGKSFAKGLKEVEGRFGIVEISEVDYNEKKNRHPYDPSVAQSLRQKEMLQVFRSPGQRPPKQPNPSVGAAAVETPKPNALELAASMPSAPPPLPDLLSESFKPATGRSKTEKAKA